MFSCGGYKKYQYINNKKKPERWLKSSRSRLSSVLRFYETHRAARAFGCHGIHACRPWALLHETRHLGLLTEIKTGCIMFTWIHKTFQVLVSRRTYFTLTQGAVVLLPALSIFSFSSLIISAAGPAQAAFKSFNLSETNGETLKLLPESSIDCIVEVSSGLRVQ